MRSCVRPVRLIQSWLRRKRARYQRSSFESPSVAYDSPEHCQSTKHGSTSNRTTSQKIKVRVYPITCPLCKGLVTSERMGGTADVRVRNMGTISHADPVDVRVWPERKSLRRDERGGPSNQRCARARSRHARPKASRLSRPRPKTRPPYAHNEHPPGPNTHPIDWCPRSCWDHPAGGQTKGRVSIS